MIYWHVERRSTCVPGQLTWDAPRTSPAISVSRTVAGMILTKSYSPASAASP